MCFADSIRLMGKSLSFQNILFFILSLISIANSCYHSSVLTPLLQNSPYLSKLPIFLWQPEIFYPSINISTIPIGIASFFIGYTNWKAYFGPSFSIVISLLQFKICNRLPFSGIVGNIILSSLYLTRFFSGICFVIVSFFNQRFLLFFYSSLIFLVSFIFSTIFILRYKKKIIRSLSYKHAFPDLEENNSNGIEIINTPSLMKPVQRNSYSKLNIIEENKRPLEIVSPRGLKIPEDRKKNYLKTLKINPYPFLQFGLENNCDLFLDWSLSRHLITEEIKNSELLLFILRLCSFFPLETQIMNTVMVACSQLKFTNIVHQVQYYQLHRAYIFWQSNSSQEMNHDFGKMKKLNDDCINRFCNFWKQAAQGNKMDPQSTFWQLTSCRIAAEALWIEMIDKYPNSPNFLKEYARFLIDVKCNFKLGLQIFSKSKKLGERQSIRNDKLFKCFIKQFPHYLKLGIVNSQGALLHNSRVSSLSNQFQPNDLASDIHSDNDTSTSLSEEGFQYDFGLKYLPKAFFRLELQKASNNINLGFLKFSTIAWNLQAFICFIYGLTIIILLGIYINPFVKLYDSLSYLESYENFLSLSNLELALTWQQNANGSITASELSNYINIMGINFEQNMNLNNNDRLGITVLEALDFSENYVNFLIKNNKYHLVSKFHSFWTKSIHYMRSCKMSNGNIYTTNEDSPITSIDLIHNQYLLVISQYAIQSEYNETTISDWANDIRFCSLFLQKAFLEQCLSALISKIVPSYGILQNRYNSGEISIDDTFIGPAPYFFNLTLSFPEDIPSNFSDVEFIDDFDSYSKIAIALIVWAPFFILSAALLPHFIMRFGNEKNRQKMMDNLLSFSPKHCQNASLPIIRDNVKRNSILFNSSLQVKSSYSREWVPPLIFATVFMIITITIILLCKDVASEIHSLNHHIMLKIGLSTFMSESITYLTFLISQNINSSIAFEKNGISTILEQLKYVFNNFKLIYSIMVNGETNEKVSAFSANFKEFLKVYDVECGSADLIYEVLDKDMGYEGEISIFNNQNSDASTYARYLKCISIDRIWALESNLINTILTQYETENLRSSNYLKLLILYFSANYYGMKDLNQSFYARYESLKLSYNIHILIYLIICVIFIFLHFFSYYLTFNFLKDQYATFLALLLRIDPIAILTNHRVLSLFTHFEKSELKVSTGSHAAFQSSNEAILTLNLEGIIEGMNPAATRLFGYTQEQLLGQPLMVVFPPVNDLEHPVNSTSQLIYAMQLMKTGTSESSIFTTKITVKSDSGAPINIEVSLLGLTDPHFSTNKFYEQMKNNEEFSRENSDELSVSIEGINNFLSPVFDKLPTNNLLESSSVTGFALVCNDLTEMNNIVMKIEEIEAQSDRLKRQILSKDFKNLMNSGDDQPLIQCDYATVIYMNFFRYSLYLSSLSPNDAIQNTRYIYQIFDKIITNYQTLSKVAIIGDSYIAVGGLFANQDSAKNAALQAVSFSLDILQQLEEFNLQARIGVFSGGKLVAEIRNQNKYRFEIIGKPLDYAQQLQFSGRPQTIHLSESCYQLTAEGPWDFSAEEYVELEGLGKVKTYYVNLTHGNEISHLDNDSFHDQQDVITELISY